MRKCPFCGERVEDKSIRCEYCGKELDKRQYNKWYFKPSVLIIAFLCIGPFALPLLWINPKFSRTKKIVISVIIIILSYYLGILINSSVRSIKTYYRQIFDELGPFLNK